jgi:hypothetical protein
LAENLEHLSIFSVNVLIQIVKDDVPDPDDQGPGTDRSGQSLEQIFRTCRLRRIYKTHENTS